MAFVQSPIPQEEQNQFAPGGQTTQNPMAMMPPQSGGSSGQASGGSAANQAPSGVGTPTQFGSNSSRLSDYLQANKDQVQNMANNISGNLGGQYSGIKNDIGGAGQQFGGQVAGGYTPTDPTLISQVQNNPVEAAKNPDSVKSFQSQLNDQYNGPTSFEGTSGYGDIQKRVTDAVQNIPALNSYAGLSTYLQNNVEKNATPGQNTLDTILLNGNQGAYQTVKDAANKFSDLPDYLGNVTKTQDQSVQDAINAASGAKQASQQALQTATGPLVQNMNQGYQDAFKKSQDYNLGLNDIADKASNGKWDSLTPEEKSQIGYNDALAPLLQQYQTLLPGYANPQPNSGPAVSGDPADAAYNQTQQKLLNLGNYFSAGQQAQTPNPANTLSQDQIDRYKALTTLGGSAPAGLNFDLPDQAGQPFSIPQQGSTFNSMGVANDMASVYGKPFQQMQDSGWTGVSPEVKQSLTDYMSQLNKFRNAPNPWELPGYQGPNPTDPAHPVFAPDPNTPNGGRYIGFV